MVFRYKTRKFDSLRGEYLIIEDTLTNKSVGILKNEVDCIISDFMKGINEGVIVNGSYFIEESIVFIESNNSKISIDILDLNVIVRNGIGVINTEKYIEYGKLSAGVTA